MSVYRVVCSIEQNKNSTNTFIDFAIADEGEASLTHLQLFKLRKYENHKAQWIMPPIFIKEIDGRTDVYFDKPKYATDEQKQKLKDISPLIKCEFNKFKHYGLKNSLEINDRNIASVYDDINPYRVASNETEARLFERIQRSIRINNQLSSKRPRVDPLLKYLMPEH